LHSRYHAIYRQLCYTSVTPRGNANEKGLTPI
jgi:hypothetical protein